MARDQVDPIGVREALQPQASPVSTYVRPAEPAPSQLHGLAQALEGFSHDIGGFFKERQAKDDDAAKVRGQAAALKANGAGYAEGVRNGSIASFESPIFVKAYKETQGEIAGKRLMAQAQTEYNTWSGRNSQDPEDFNKFLGDFMKNNITTDDPDVLRGAIPFMTQTATALYSANENERSTALYNNSISATIASSSMDVDAADDLGLSTGTGTDYKALWAGMMDTRAKALATGVLAADYDKQLLLMVASKAAEHKDPALLGLLANQVPGQDFTYANTPQGREVLHGALDKMETENNEAMRLKAAADAKRDKDQQDKNTAYVIDELAKNPNAIFPEDFLKQAKALDPTLIIRMKEWGKTLAAGGEEDDTEILGLQQDIFNGGGLAVVQHAMDQGVIKNPSTAAQLFNLVNSVNSKDFKPVLENQTVKDGLNLLNKSLIPDQTFADPTAINPAAMAARLDFTLSLQAWSNQHPNASYNEVSTEAANTLKRIMGGITQDQEGQPAYATPAAIEQVVQGQQNEGPQNTATVTPSMAKPKGLLQGGTIDLNSRPTVNNADGSISTVSSMSFEENGKEILIPTISPQGEHLTDQQAIDLYHQTGQHLGIFDNPEDATAYAEALHQDQDKQYGKTDANPLANEQQPPEVKPAPADPKQTPWQGDAPPDINSLEPAQRAKLEQFAKQMGIDPAEMLPGLYEKLHSKGVAPVMGTPPVGANLTPEASAQQISSTSAHDPYGTATATNPMEFAKAYLGKSEGKDAGAISAFIKQAAGIDINPASTAWCAAFVDAVLHASGGAGTGKLNAKSYLNWGQPVTEPQPGDIVVFDRGGGMGHVGFFASSNPDGTINVLGGNQSDSVKLSIFKTDNVLGYRRAA